MSLPVGFFCFYFASKRKVYSSNPFNSLIELKFSLFSPLWSSIYFTDACFKSIYNPLTMLFTTFLQLRRISKHQWTRLEFWFRLNDVKRFHSFKNLIFNNNLSPNFSPVRMQNNSLSSTLPSYIGKSIKWTCPQKRKENGNPSHRKMFWRKYNRDLCVRTSRTPAKYFHSRNVMFWILNITYMLLSSQNILRHKPSFG